MRKLFLFALLSFCQLTIAAENDPPAQETDQLETAEAGQESSQEGDNDLIAAEISDTNGEEEESSVRFIPTEEISQDFGVSFPVDI